MATNQTKVIISAEDKTGAALASVQKNLKGLEGHFAGLDAIAGRIPLLGSALTAAFGSVSLTGLVKSTIDAADNLNDLSQRVGISIKDLATWDLAARQSGTSLESVAKGVKGLSTYMVENGKALKAAGINATDANGALIELADIFKAMPDGIEKTALVVKMFGKAGMDLLPVLNLGSAGLREAQEKAAEYGKKMAELAPAADKFNDQLEELALQSRIAGVNMAALVTGPMAAWLEANNQANRISGGLSETLRLFVFNLDAMTTEKPREEISRLTKEIENFKKEMESELRSPFINEKLIADHGKKIQFLKFLERQQVMANASELGDYRDARDLRLANGSTMSVAEAMAKAAALRGNAGKAGKAGKVSDGFDPDDVLYKIQEAVEKQRRAAIIAADKEEDALEAKARAMDDMAMKRMEMYRIETEGEEAVRESLEKSTAAVDEMSQFAIEAARNMQDAFAEFLFDPFSDGTSNMLDKFTIMLRKMAAQAAAAQLSNALFGDMGKTGNVGGLAGDLFKSVIGAFSGGYGDTAGLAAGVPRFAEGTDFVPRTGLALIHQGERIIPAAQNKPGFGGMTVVNQFTISGPVDRRTQEQIAAMAGISIQRAMTRNT